AVLRRAHEMIDDDATDDAALVERLGGTVAVVEGDPENIKVTYRGDLAIVETILLGRSDHG
ncbi:MAG: 2-C-methyl-D-erythritol 4-phosphate cytidylyltransferase, partial [Acidimicrobiia bacterium]|nr:2-C-methyl-D-erythritol 4-phosphate cytidylyltransferase [Acidimicrobiia bacterium]